MRANCCALQGLQGHIPSFCYPRQSRERYSAQSQRSQPVGRIESVVIVDFRDEVYASIAELLMHCGLIVYRAEDASELAARLVSQSPELVLLSGTQPDESAWLTSAKLRIIDAQRPVWIYAPEPPSAIDQWLSMAATEEVIVYEGVLHRLLDLLRSRISLETTSPDRVAKNGQRPRAA